MEDKVYAKAHFIERKYDPSTVTIEGVEHIYLTQKGIDIKVEVHIDNFDKIEEIIINGRKFKKVEL